MKTAQGFFTIIGILLAGSVLLISFYLWRMYADRLLHVQQRQARFTLFVFIVALIDYVIMVGVLRYSWEPSIAVFALCGFSAFTELIGHAEYREGKVTADERDREINMKATAAGLAIFWGSLCIAWTILFGIAGPHAKFEIGDFGLVLLSGMVIIQSVRAFVMLLMYRRNARGEAN
jgi:uncharacterized membrane protein